MTDTINSYELPILDSPSETSATLESEPIADAKTESDSVLVVLRGQELYYISGEESVLLSESAGDIDLFYGTEMIADGTIFVVENPQMSDSFYTPDNSDDEYYRVGNLYMITPDGKRKKIDESVYEVVYSQQDSVCYYQVVETDRQKLCVIIDGVSHDLTGWVDQNIVFEYGVPNGSLVYFRHITEDRVELCIGQGGAYEVAYESENNVYWLTGDDQDPVYIVDYAYDILHFSVYEDGEIVAELPDGVNWDINFKNGNLILESTDHDLLLFEDDSIPIVLATGMASYDELALVDIRGFATDWVLFSINKVLYILDTNDRATEPVMLGPVDEWYYSYDPVTETVYITGDADMVYIYVLGDEEARAVPLMEKAVNAYQMDGAAESFYYFTGDTDTYDYTVDSTDLYYYDGNQHVLLMSGAYWYVGKVVPAFDGAKVFYLANGNLYMADADGYNQQTALYDAWWVTESGGDIYAISYDGEVYLISEDGSQALIMDGVDDFLVLKPEW